MRMGGGGGGGGVLFVEELISHFLNSIFTKVKFLVFYTVSCKHDGHRQWNDEHVGLLLTP